MGEIQIYTQIHFNKVKEFESRNLSYSKLENIDFKNCVEPISFFRSDFRGTKFENVSFYKNNFDRSDFLNAIVLDSSFEKVNFGCCQIKNCYFENVAFSNNSYRNTSIHSSVFKNCSFPDESFLINMQRCKFINCTFNGCNFEMSTTDSDEFEKCNFISSNLATMHAENHSFVKCNFNNVYIDSSYYFGYRISKCSFQNIKFLYRGEYVDFSQLNSVDLLNDFVHQHRFVDVINLLKTCNRENEIPHYISLCIDFYDSFIWGRMLDIINVINTLSFYAVNEDVSFDIIYRTIQILEKINLTSYSFDEKNIIVSAIIKLKNSLLCSPHSQEYIDNLDKSKMSLVTITFNSDNYDVSYDNSIKFINSVSNVDYWKLIDAKKGSWVLVFAVSTFILLTALPRIIKNYSDVYFDIKIKQSLSKKIVGVLNESKSLNELNKICSSINQTELLIPAGKSLNEREIQDITSLKIDV